MPLINQGSSIKPGSRSHTGLVKSAGDSPSEQWIIDPSLPGLFQYDYVEGRHLSKVVIPKGTIVAVGPPAKDYATLKYRNIITFADGTVDKLPIGVAPYNYMRRFNADGTIAHDQFGGDDFQPAIITREYIEVPYLPNPADVYTYSSDATPVVNGMKMMWGCLTNVSEEIVGTADEVKAGDYVKPGPFGKFVKWEPGDDPRLMVGQILALETDMPPLGWLQYVEPEYEGSDSMRENNPVEPAPADGSQVYWPDYKWPLTRDYRSPGAWKTIGGGWPGLTDGANIALTTRIQRFSLVAGATSLVCYLDPACKVQADTLHVYLEGVELGTSGDNRYAYDPKTQSVTVTAVASDDIRTVRITYTVDPATMVGVPPSWDYAGSIGAARILLKL